VNGSGVADLDLNPDGTPRGVIIQHLYGNTYRYIFSDKNRTNETGIVRNGEILFTFRPAAWKDSAGTANIAFSEGFTVRAGTTGSGSTSEGLSLGPLVLQGPTVGLSDFSFNEGKLLINVGIGVDSASLSFGGGGQSASGITANLTGVLGTFEIAVDVLGMLDGGSGDLFGATGAFTFSVSALEVEVPNVIRVTASGISVGYDPGYDPAEHEGLAQKIIEIQSATVSFDRFGLSGTIAPFDPGGGEPLIPGLVIRTNGFALGRAELCYGCGDDSLAAGSPDAAIKIGSILEFDDIRIGITDFSVTFGSAIDFNGSIYIASGGASFFPGKPISARISDRTTAEPGDSAGVVDTEALRVELTFTAGHVDALLFDVDTFRVELGTFLTLTGRDLSINSGASSTQEVVSFAAIGAELRIGSFVVGGEARNFGFLGDGTFTAKSGFAVVLSVGGASGGSVGWPDWLPIQINSLGLEWDDITSAPGDFVVTLSASVTGIKGIGGLEFSGAIEGVRIDPQLLFEGKFPIVDIASLGVQVSGKMFGGEIDAALIGGIIKLDGSAQVIDPTDTTTPVADRVFFMGLEGGFSFPGVGGITIRLALSELGPLGVFLTASVPGGILLEPNTGLSINDFSAGVEFFTTLPSIDDPLELRDPAFGAPTDVTVDQWLSGVKNQVVQQYRLIQENPNREGFAAAFTAPMTITGGAKIFSIYTSKEVFNGEVMIKLSTDGKFLIVGKLNFAADNVSISGRLYADLSNVDEGDVTVLFLADVPDQVRLLTIDGKLKMGFKNASGEEVAFDVVDPANIADPDARPVAELASPAAGAHVDVRYLNGRTFDSDYYIDVIFTPSTGNNLDYASIFDPESEFSIVANGGSYTVSGVPVAVTTATSGSGLLETTAVAQGASETDQAYYARLTTTGVTRFRYFIDDATFAAYVPGSVEVQFAADGVLHTEDGAPGLGNEALTLSFTVEGPKAALAAPFSGTRIDLARINGRLALQITFRPTSGSSLIHSTIDGDEITVTSSGTAAIDATRAPERVGDTSTYIYYLTGAFVPGTVTVSVAGESFQDDGGFTNLAWSDYFQVEGPAAALAAPLSGEPVGLSVVNGSMYLDLLFSTSDGESIDWTSVDGDELLLSGDGLGSVALDASRAPERSGTSNTVRYYLTGAFTTGEVTVEIVAGSFNNAGAPDVANIGAVQSFVIAVPTAALADPLAAEVTDRQALSDRGYIDIVFSSKTGSPIEPGSIDGDEITLLAPAGSTVSLDTSRAPQRQGDGTTYRYYTVGVFAAGTVTVEFNAESWSDTEGNVNLAESISFTTIGQATSFVIELSGGLTLQAADFLDEPLLSMRGEVNLDINLTDLVFTLDMSGTVSIIEVGVIGSAAGRFTLDTGASIGATPNLWGVLKLETNLTFLEEYGITMEGQALLAVNTTALEKIEVLNLKGIPGDVLFTAEPGDLSDLADGSTLSSAWVNRFAAAGVTVAPSATVDEIVTDTSWKVTDGEVTYFIDLVPGPDDGTTADDTVEVTGEDQAFVLAAESFLVQVIGQATLADPENSDDVWFTMRGGFRIEISSDHFELFALAKLNALSMADVDARGFMHISDAGIAGQLVMSVEEGLEIGDIPGVSFSGSAMFMFNSTLNEFEFEIPEAFVPYLDPDDPTVIILPASAPDVNGEPVPGALPSVYLQVQIQGQLNLLDQITLTGFFSVTGEANTEGAEIEIAGFVSANVRFLGALSGSVSFTARIGNGGGLWGSAELVLASSGAIPGVDLSGRFFLEVNTSDQTQSIMAFAIDPETGEVADTATATDIDPLTLRIALGGHLQIGTVFLLEGKFSFSISPTQLEIIANARLDIDPFGSVTVNGALLVNSQGLVARIDISAGIGDDFANTVGIDFDADFLLELNTGSVTRTVDGYDVEPGLLIHIAGSVEFLGFASGSGSVDIIVRNDRFELYFDVDIALGPLAVEADGFAGVYADGIALRLAVSVDANVFDIFTIEAAGEIQVNTTDDVHDGIADNSFLLDLHGKIEILAVLNFESSFKMVVANGAWRIDFASRMDFFGLVTLNANGWLQSNGYFHIVLDGRLVLGTNSFGLVGTLGFEVWYDDVSFGLAIAGSVQLRAFGLTFAGLGAEARFEVFTDLVDARVKVEMSLTVTIDLFFFSVSKTARFMLGYLEIPKPVWLAGDAGTTQEAARSWSGGTLYLNMGDTRGQYRNLAEDEVDEGFTIEHIAGDENGETVKIVAMGRTQIFENVTAIVADAGSGDDQLFVGDGVQVPVTAYGGSGDDIIIYEGSGDYLIYADDGVDYIELAGRGNGSAYGGAGDDFIRVSGGGESFVDAGAGDDVLTAEAVVSLSMMTLGQITLDGGDGNDEITGSRFADILRGGSGADTLLGAAGDDRLEGGTGDDRYLFRNGFGSDSVDDTDGVDILDFSAVTTVQNVTIGSSDIVVATDGGALTAGTSPISEIVLGATPDEVDVSGFRDYDLTVRDTGGNDLYAFHLAEALSGRSSADIAAITRVVSIVDENGSFDEIVVEELSAATPIYLETGSVSNGSERIDISGIERATVTGAGASITGTHAASHTASVTLFGNAVSVTTGAADSVARLGGTGLRLVGSSVTLLSDITAGHIVIDSSGTFTLDRELRVTGSGYLDVRTYAPSADIELAADIYAEGGGWLRLTSASGSLANLSSAKMIGPNAHLILTARGSIGTEDDPVLTRVARLTAATSERIEGDIVIHEDDDLQIVAADSQAVYEADGYTVRALSATPEFVRAVIDGNPQEGLAVAGGSLQLTLLGRNARLTHVSGRIVGRFGPDEILLTADDIDFLAGEGSVVGANLLTIQANSDPWIYTLGTAAEDVFGVAVDHDTFGDGPYFSALELSTLDIEAIADGFARIEMGRRGSGNEMTLGDLMYAEIIKHTGDPRVVDASLKDTAILFADSMDVRGDVRAPADRLTLNAELLRVHAKNIHNPDGAPDSGVAAEKVSLLVAEQLIAGGWIRGNDRVEITVTDTDAVGADILYNDGPNSVTTDLGSSIESLAEGSTVSVNAVGSVKIAGIIEVYGESSRLLVESASSVTVLEGGILAARDAEAEITVAAEDVITLEAGSAVTAGAEFDYTSGSPVAVMTGEGADVHLISTYEMTIGGSVTSSDAMELVAGPAHYDHSDYFSGIGNVDPDHYLVNQDSYSILLTGTLTTLAGDSLLALTAGDEIIIRGNIDVVGADSDLLIRSDAWVYIEGFLTVTDRVDVYGGYDRFFAPTDGADSRGSSVYVHETARINTLQAGSGIRILGSKDVDIYGAVVAGGSIGPSGVTWAGPDSILILEAGEQLYLASGALASATVRATGGVPGSDDNDIGLLVDTAGGLYAYGWTSDGSGALVAVTSHSNLEVTGHIVSGANVTLDWNPDGTLRGKNFDWSPEPSRLFVTTEGRAYIGGHTRNAAGEEIETGGYLYAGDFIRIEGGTHYSDTGVLVHPASEVVTHRPDSRIEIVSETDAEVQGVVLAGGTVENVRDATGAYLGRRILDGGGNSTLLIQAGHQVRIGTELRAGKTVDLVGGFDPIESDPLDGSVNHSGKSILIYGSGRIATWSEDSRINLNGPGRVDILAPADQAELAATDWIVSADGTLPEGVSVVLNLEIDKVDFTIAASVVIEASATSENATIEDLIADIENAMLAATWSVASSDSDEYSVGDIYAGFTVDPAVGIPDLQVKLRDGRLVLAGPYEITLRPGSLHTELLGFAPQSGPLESSLRYAVSAAEAGSEVNIGAPGGPNGKLYIAGKILAYRTINLYSGTSPDGIDIDLDWTGVLETVNGPIAFYAGVLGDIKGDVVAGGAGSYVEITAGSALAVRGDISASDRITLSTVGSGMEHMALSEIIQLRDGTIPVNTAYLANLTGGLLADGERVSVLTEGTSTLTLTGTTSALRSIQIGGFDSVIINSRVGTGSSDLDSVYIISAGGNVYVTEESGRIETSATVAASGANVVIAGVIDGPARTFEPDGYSLMLNANDTLVVTGDIASYGSSLLKAGMHIAVFDAEVEVNGPEGVLDIVSGGSIQLGEVLIAENHPVYANGNPYNAGALLAAPAQVTLAAAGLLEVLAGVQITSTADDSLVIILAGDLDLVGAVHAGATVAGEDITWSGANADIVVDVPGMVTVGGFGYDEAGELVARGGSFQATGTITVTAGTSTGNVDFYLSAESLVRTDATGDGELAVPAAPSAISIVTSGALQIFGLVAAYDDGSTLLLGAGNQVRVDGLVRADESVTITGGNDSSGMSIEITPLLIQVDDITGIAVDDQGRLIDRDGFLIDEAGNWVDESGDPIPETGAPVYGGPFVRLAGGTVATGPDGVITLTGSQEIRIYGHVGQLKKVSGLPDVDTSRIEITTPGDLFIHDLVTARDEIVIDAHEINILGDAVVRGRHSGSEVYLHAEEVVFIQRSPWTIGRAKVEAGRLVHLHGRELQVEGSMRADDADGEILLSAIDDAIVFGDLVSVGSITIHAGVPDNFTRVQLEEALFTSALLSSGSIYLNGEAALQAGSDVTLVAANEVALEAYAELADGERQLPAPHIVTEERIIQVVVGSRRVADGVIYVPEVHWVTTTVTEQVGVEEVVVGSKFYTLDITLVQDGYWNGTTKREYFIEGDDYFNYAGSGHDPAKVIDWGNVTGPATDATFGDLNDAQAERVLNTLGYKPLYDLQWANPQEHGTIDGVPYSKYWNVPWSGSSGTEIVIIDVAGWNDKYIRLPVGSATYLRDQVLRVVSQGEPETFNETVGYWRESAVVRYTQDRSVFESYSYTKTVYDQYGIPTSFTVTSTVYDYDNSPGRWDVDYARDGTREFWIYDGRTGSNTVELAELPDWYYSTYSTVGNDARGRYSYAPNGYFSTTASITGQVLVGTRGSYAVGRDPYYSYHGRSYSYVSGSYDFWQAVKAALNRSSNTQTFIAQPQNAAQNDGAWWTIPVSGQAWLGGVATSGSGWIWIKDYIDVTYDLSSFHVTYYTSNISPISYTSWNSGEPNNAYVYAGGLSWVRAEYYIEMFGDWDRRDKWNDTNVYDTQGFVVQYEPWWSDRTYYETYNDYEYNWTSQWNAITDTRQTIRYQWVSRAQDVTGLRPRYETYEAQIPVVEERAVTKWKTELIYEDQTIFVTERVYEDGDPRAFGVFTGDSIRAGNRVLMDAGGSLSLTGRVVAAGDTGTIELLAGTTITVAGRSVDDGNGTTLAAVAELQAGHWVSMHAAEDVTLAASTILTVDGSAPIESYAELTAGGSLSAGGGIFGRDRVTLTASDDIALSGTVTAGDRIEVTAGSVDRTGSITGTIDADLLTYNAGSKIQLTAGVTSGSISLSGTALQANDEVRLAAPSGSVSHDGGRIRGARLYVRARHGVVANTGVSAADVVLSGTGNISLTNLGDNNLTSLATADGSITVENYGAITATSVRSQTDRDENDITLITRDPAGTGGADITVRTVDAGMSGDVTLSAAGVIRHLGSVRLRADGLTLSGQRVDSLNSDVSSLVVGTIGTGSVTVNERNQLRLPDVSVLNGGFTLTAGGTVIAEKVELLTNAEANNISITTTAGNIVVGYVTAGVYESIQAGNETTSLGNVKLDAAGAISELAPEDGAVDAVGDLLRLYARGGGISGLEIAGNTLDAYAASGSITLTESDGPDELSPGLEISLAYAASGNVTVTAAGDISFGARRYDSGLSSAQSLGWGYSAGTVTLESLDGNILVSDGATGISSVSDLILTAAGDLVIAGPVSAANRLEFHAGHTFVTPALSSGFSAHTVIIEAGSSLTVEGTIAATELIKLVSNGGNVTLAGDIVGLGGAPLERIILVARGNLITRGELSGYFAWAAEGTRYYESTDGTLYTRVGGELVPVSDPTSLRLTPVIQIVGETVIDGEDNGNGTGLQIYRDPSGNTFYFNPVTDSYYRWLQANGRYSFSGLNKLTGELATFFATTTEPAAGTIYTSSEGTATIAISDIENLTFAYTEVTDSVITETLEPVTVDIPAGRIVITEGGLTEARDELVLHAGAELVGIGLDITITGANGVIDVSTGGDLVAGGLMRADGRVSLASTGYVDVSGIYHGGNLTVDGAISGYSTGLAEAELAAAGNISLSVTLTSEDRVDLVAGGSITAAPTSSLITGTLNVSVTGSVELFTEVDRLHVAVAGPGNLTVTESDAIELTGILVEDGSITVTSGGTMIARSVEVMTDQAGNDIALTASAGDVLIGLVRTGRQNGHIDVRSPLGSIREIDEYDAEADIAAYSAYLKALLVVGSVTDPNLNLEFDVTSLEIDAFDLILNVVGDIELNIALQGIATVTATGSITVTSLVALGNEVNLSAGGDILIGFLDAGADAGIVSLTAGRDIREVNETDADIDIVSEYAAMSAGRNIGGDADHPAWALETELARIQAESGGTGAVTLAEATDIELVQVTTADGPIYVTAGGSLHVGHVTAGNHGEVVLHSGAHITGDPGTITADRLEVTAIGMIELYTAVSTLTAYSTGGGDITVTEQDDIVLESVRTTGDVTVTAGGSVSGFVEADTLGVDAGGAIELHTAVSTLHARTPAELTVTENDAIDLQVNASLLRLATTSAGDVSIASDTDVMIQLADVADGTLAITADGRISTIAGSGVVSAVAVDATAGTGIELGTETESFSAYSLFGDIIVRDIDDLEVQSVTAVDGSVGIYSGGSVTALLVNVLADSAERGILISAPGDIVVDLLHAGATAGTIRLVAGGSVRERSPADTDVDLAAAEVIVVLGGEWGDSADPSLEPELEVIRFAFTGPELVLRQDGDVELFARVSGVVDARVSGSLTLRDVRSLDGPVIAWAGSNMPIDFVSAPNVTLVAGADITEADIPDASVDIETVELRLTTGGFISGIETAVDVIAVSAGESLTVAELDSIEITALAAGSDAEVTAGGSMTATGAVTAGGRVRLSADGDLTVAARIAASDISMNAADNIRVLLDSGLLVADTVSVTAGGHAVLLTDTVRLSAQMTGTEALEVREADGIVLDNVSSAAGPIRVIAGGAIEVRNVEVFSDSAGGSVSLIAIDGDVLIDRLFVGRTNGQITVSAPNGDIREVDDFDPDVDLSGWRAILSAGGEIGSRHHPELNLETDLGELIQPRGGDLRLRLHGDVDLFFVTNGRIDVKTTGTINVLYLDSLGHDISLDSRYKDINVDIILADSGSTKKPDVRLKAGGDITVSDVTLTGDAGRIVAGRDISLRANGSVAVHGAITAGDSIAVHADQSILIHAPVTAGDDVKIDSRHANVTVHAAITAGDDILIEAQKEVTIAAPVVAGDNLLIRSTHGAAWIADTLAALEGSADIRAAEQLSLSHSIAAAGDVRLDSRHGELVVSGGITAGDDISLTAGEDILLSATLTAGDDVRVDSRHGNVIVSGSVTASDDIEITARYDITVTGLLDAGDDITLTSRCGTVNVTGSAVAGDRIRLHLPRHHCCRHGV